MRTTLRGLREVGISLCPGQTAPERPGRLGGLTHCRTDTDSTELGSGDPAGQEDCGRMGCGRRFRSSTEFRNQTQDGVSILGRQS